MAATPLQASNEKVRRERSRASLVDFSQSIDVPGVPAADIEDEFDARRRLIEMVSPK